MSSAPPPGGYPPPFDPNAWKRQQQMMRAQAKAAAAAQKAQLRAQRMQWKAQQRAARRSTLIGPLLLVAIGVVVLLAQMHIVTWNALAYWYAHWWPLVLIGAGLLLVAEWALAQHNHVPGQPYPQPALGGGLVFLLILMASVGFTLRHTDNGQWWTDHVFNDKDWSQWFGDQHDSDIDLSSSIASGAPLLVRTPHGDVTVTGTSNDGQVHVTVHRHVRAWDSDDVPARERDLQPKFSSDGNQLVLAVGSAKNSDADVTLEVPHDTPLTVLSSHGDVNVSELRSAIDITQSHGDLEASSLDGPLTVHVSDDNATLTGHSITGTVDIEGRAGDMTFSDITGSLTMHGDFFGSTHVSHVSDAVRFLTSRTQFSAARLDGDLDIANDSDFTGDQLVGPVTLTTANRNITLERVQGVLSVTNRNGSVTTTSTRPFDAISIHNVHGSVDVGVPEHTGFVLTATTNNGDIDAKDFDMSSNGSKSSTSVHGAVSGGGPGVAIDVRDGDITVHTSDAAPLAPRPPAPPVVVTEPPPPSAPAKPKTPTKPKTPPKPVDGDTF